MRNLKKFLALVLAFMMTMSLMVTVNASNIEGTPDGDTVNPAFQEAVDVLLGMGIIRGGDNGAIKPQENISRAEMAAFIYRLYTGDVDRDQEHLYAETGTRFTDVKAGQWYSGVIGYCASQNFILGRGDGTFDPDANVTGYEALLMVLRAMGYGKGGEFTGGEWQQIVHTRAGDVGLLANVNSVSYGRSLPQPATREFVAEIIFRAANLPMVTYNQGFINNYKFMNAANGVEGQTLGQWRFGLTAHTGVLVGNQSTGEDCTKIGFSVIPNITYQADGTTPYRLVGGTISDNIFLNLGGNSAYNYESASDTLANLQTNNNGANVTLSFYDNEIVDYLTKETVVEKTAQTGLNLFNHKVKVWYDNRSNILEPVVATTNAGTATFPTDVTTYTIIDQAKKAEVVKFVPTGGTATVATDTALTGWNATSATVENLGEAAKNAGFNVKPTNTDSVYWNYAFSPLKDEDYATVANGTTTSNVSPIKMNNSQNSYQLYLVISNDEDATLDVIISLDLSINEIAEENFYQLPNSFGVWTSNAQASADVTNNHYFGQGLAGGDDIITVSGGEHDQHEYLNIPIAHLLNTDADKLNKYDPVAVVAIAGTANNVDRTAATVYVNTDFDHSNGNADSLTDLTASGHKYNFSDNTFYYQITKLTRTEVGTVKYISTEKAVTIEKADGSVVTLNKSILAEATDGHFAGNRDKGVNDVQRNEKYYFYLDEKGEYLFYEKDRAETTHFVYSTYLDWSTGFITSEFGYGLSYVNPNGETDRAENIKKIDGNTIGVENQLPYYDVKLPKREDTSAHWNSSVVPGQYFGYLLNDKTGVLTSITATNDQRTGFFQATDQNFGAAKIEIKDSDVTVGAKIIGTAGNTLALTNDTQFYLVEGAGTANVKVTSAKLRDLKDLTIDVQQSAAYLNNSAANFLMDANKIDDDNGNLYKMVYYSLDSNSNYAQIIEGGAKPVATVFIPMACVSGRAAASGSTKLVFVGDMNTAVIWKNSSTDDDLKATEFNVFDASTGNPDTVWIEGYYDGSDNTTTSGAKKVYDTNSNVFYKLEDTGKKANNEKAIYKLAKLSDTERGRVVGRYWDYDADTVAWSDNNAGLMGATNEGRFLPAYFGGYTYGYIANESWAAATNLDSDKHLVKVDEAKVVNLNEVRYPRASTPRDLLYTSSIDINEGIKGVSYYLKSTASASSVVGVVYINAPTRS